MIGDAFSSLVKTMERLRGPGGCPWDREQTHTSLRPYLLEESYEALDALDSSDPESLKEELGDLLLQIVFHALIAEENGSFSILDVLKTLNEKLLRRHPHVFGGQILRTSIEQKAHWERIKREEGKTIDMDGIPKALPALLYAQRIQQYASERGFDWKEAEPVVDKVKEEWTELVSAFRSDNRESMTEEFGDVLFSLVNLSRFFRIDPEDSLKNSTRKFIRRFKKVEIGMKKRGKPLDESHFQEMDNLWNLVKKTDRPSCGLDNHTEKE